LAIKFFHRVLIIGATQSGKTTYLKKAIVPHLPRFVVYDPDLHFGDVKGVKVVTTYEKFEDVFPYHNRIVFQPDDSMMGNFDKRVEEFEAICKRINDLGVKMTFVVDEISHVTLKRSHAIIPQEFQKMIKRRMKAPTPERPQGNIGIFVTTQRPKDAAVDFITQCQHVISFKLLPKDIDYVKDAFPFNIDIESLINFKLKKYEAIHYDMEENNLAIVKLSDKVTSKIKTKSEIDAELDDFLDLITRKGVM
jgi:hypothetical protein